MNSVRYEGRPSMWGTRYAVFLNEVEVGFVERERKLWRFTTSDGLFESGGWRTRTSAVGNFVRRLREVA